MYYAKNREVLVDKLLGQSLVNMLDKTEPETEVELVETVAGDYSLIYKGIPLHSMAGAEDEAKNAVKEYIRPQLKGHHFIMGIGLGYLLQAVHETSEGSIYLYESDLPLLRFVLENVDLSTYMAERRVHVATNPKDLRELVGWVYNYGDEIDFVYVEGYAQLWGNELPRLIKDEVMGVIRGKRNSIGTIVSLQDNWNAQFCENMRYLPQVEPFTPLQNQFKNRPAVIVSAGPSLDKAIDTLKTLQDKVVIIAVGTALRALINAGIEPDFAVILDFGGIDKQLSGVEDKLENTAFLLGPYADKICHTIPVKRRFQMFLSNYPDFCTWIGKQIGHIEPPMSSDGTVSILAFQSAIALGCDPLILAGQDLAITGEQLYAGGIGGQLDSNGNLVVADSDQVLGRILALIDVPGQNGEILKSPRDYAQYIGDFSEAARRYLQEFPERSLYNASVGGAQIMGFKNRSLQDLAQSLPFETFDKTLPPLSEYSVEQKRKNVLASAKVMRSVIKDYIKLSKEAREHLVFLKQGIEKSPSGTNHEQRYLALHKQCAQRIAVHHVISHFLQKEIWAMYRDANTQSQNVQDIIANYAAEDRYYERCEKVLSKVLPMLDDSIKALEANVPV